MMGGEVRTGCWKKRHMRRPDIRGFIGMHPSATAGGTVIAVDSGAACLN
mgnify:CR=1 FL=1